MYGSYGLSPAVTSYNRDGDLALYTPESRQRLEAAREKWRETGAPYGLERGLVRPDGAHRGVAARAGVLRDEGGWPRLVGVVQDITGQRESEAQSRWNSKMLAQIATMGKIGGYEWTDRKSVV